MSDLFLDPRILNYQGDRYELILYTLRWARALKAKGSPESMPHLIEQALKDIVDKKITKEEILANKAGSVAPAEEVPAVVSVADEGQTDEQRAARAALAAEEAAEEKKGKKKAKKKEDEE